LTRNLTQRLQLIFVR